MLLFPEKASVIRPVAEKKEEPLTAGGRVACTFYKGLSLPETVELLTRDVVDKIRRERLDAIPFAQSLTMQLLLEPYKNLTYLRL